MEENKKTSFKEFYTKHKSKFNFCYMVAICIILAKLITSFVFISVVVDGSSMYPTLENGYKGITDGVFYKMSGINRFDVVILKLDNYEEKLVKRVIGLPGETIEYKNSVLYVNGEVIEETFLPSGTRTELTYNRDFKVTLKDDEYYVLGDNRTNSKDSRSFGPVRKDEIVGNGILLFASCDSVTSDGTCKGLKLNWPRSVK